MGGEEKMGGEGVCVCIHVSEWVGGEVWGICHVTLEVVFARLRHPWDFFFSPGEGFSHNECESEHLFCFSQPRMTVWF